MFEFVFKTQNCFSHELWNISKLWNFGKFPNIGKFLNFGKIFSKIFVDKNVYPDNIFSRNFSLLSRPLDCIKGICMYLLKFHCKNPEMYKFHCFQAHYTLLK